MSNPSCRAPLCSFNCCDKSGSCPSFKDQCVNSPLRNPVWIYVVIGVVIICILILALIVLFIFRKRRQRLEQQRKEEEGQTGEARQVEIQMRNEEEPKVVVHKAVKKNIYVYEREVIEDEAFKSSRSGTGSSKNSKKSSVSQRPQQNPFEKKKFLRERFL